MGIIKSARVDQTKATLNSGIAECLQLTRTDPEKAERPKAAKDKLVGLDAAGCAVEADKDKCSDFMLKPKEEGESYFYPIDFTVRNGEDPKIEIPLAVKGI